MRQEGTPRASQRRLSAAGRPVVSDAAGSAPRMIGTGRDGSDERTAHEALRESEQRLRAIVDSAPVGINELDPAGNLVHGNPRFFEIVGYPPADLLGRPLSEIVHGDDRTADLEHTRALLAGETTHYSCEKRFLRPDGSVVRAQVSRALVRGPGGEPERIVGVVRDVTEQRLAEAEVLKLNAELEDRVRQRTAELEQANQNMEAFTYSVSHDLRAPLRALSGFSEALLEECADALDEAGRQYAHRIVAASERMGTLIDDLLHLSRVSRTTMNVRPVDLSAEVAAIAGDLRRRDPGRAVRLSVQDGVWVLADAALIRSVAQNLIENAWKFTGKRADAVIEFGAAPGPDGMLDCYVSDNGAGFEPDYVGKLFQPFQRLHAVTDFPGTGIGLASVRRIVERHGGRAWAAGAVGKGATFHITLPPAAPASAQAGT